MSRFVDNNIDEAYSYLSEEQKRYLYTIIEKTIQQKEKYIKDKIKELNRDYCVEALTNEIEMVIQKSQKTQTIFYIGYPFPIYHQEAQPLDDSWEVDFYIRGKSLRLLLNQNCIEKIRSYYHSSSYQIIENMHDFSKMAETILGSCYNKKITYFDFNSYIGDGMIELQWVDALKKQYELKDAYVISKNAEHYQAYYPSIVFENRQAIQKAIMDSSAIFIGDLLDSHVARVEAFFRQFVPSIPVFLIGKNTILIPKKDFELQIYRYGLEDPLLRNQGFFVYMKECITPFLPTTNLKAEFTIFINLFSSKYEKDIKYPFIKGLIEFLSSHFSYHYLFSTGIENAYQKEVIQQVLKMAEENGCQDRVQLLHSDNLTQMYEQLNCRNITVGITADTSVAHLLTRSGILNFTCYQNGFWDSCSEQSLSSESFLGYCSDDIFQIPVLINHLKCYDDIIESMMNFQELFMMEKKKHEMISHENMMTQKMSHQFDENERIYQSIQKGYSKEVVQICETLFHYLNLNIPISILKQNTHFAKRVFTICPLIKLSHWKEKEYDL